MSWKRKYSCLILRSNLFFRKGTNRCGFCIVLGVIVLVNLMAMSSPLLHWHLDTTNNTNQKSQLSLTSDPTSPVLHVVFLKVHKAAGTTMMNIIMRFAIARNLSIMLPRTGNMFSQYNHLMPRKALPSFHENKRMFDVFCNHVIFKRELIAPFFPADTVYIGTVRQPFEQFVSAFTYYRDLYEVKYLMKIPGKIPIKTYLSNPSFYEAKKVPFSYTNNRMAFDFGYPAAFFHNITKFHEYLNKLDNEFDLVIVVDLFDESLILMKHLLKWNLKDILYIRKNSFKKTQNVSFSFSERLIHRKWARLDYALYNHYKSVLVSKIKSAGPDFMQEVEHFQKTRRKVEAFCKHLGGNVMLLIEESEFSSQFVVNQKDCKFHKLDAISIINVARQKHSARLDELGIVYCPQNKSSSECKAFPHL